MTLRIILSGGNKTTSEHPQGTREEQSYFGTIESP